MTLKPLRRVILSPSTIDSLLSSDLCREWYKVHCRRNTIRQSSFLKECQQSNDASLRATANWAASRIRATASTNKIHAIEIHQYSQLTYTSIYRSICTRTVPLPRTLHSTGGSSSRFKARLTFSSTAWTSIKKLASCTAPTTTTNSEPTSIFKQ